MEAFLQSYGLWILVAAVFVAMHWFGMGCSGGHEHGPQRRDEPARPGEEKKTLTALREDFAKEAGRIWQDIRAAEDALAQLYTQTPLDLPAIEAKIRQIAALQGDLRIARVKTIQKGVTLLTDEQRQKLFEPSRPMGRMGA